MQRYDWPESAGRSGMVCSRCEAEIVSLLITALRHVELATRGYGGRLCACFGNSQSHDWPTCGTATAHCKQSSEPCNAFNMHETLCDELHRVHPRAAVMLSLSSLTGR
ncbi:hypothetical protein MRB53_036840 [Persea americana]|nr:hypothetical protein MRB53_036840 [Persea americana]